MKSKTYLGTGVLTYLEAKVESNCSPESGIVVVITISFLNFVFKSENYKIYIYIYFLYLERESFERKVRKNGGRRGNEGIVVCFALL